MAEIEMYELFGRAIFMGRNKPYLIFLLVTLSGFGLLTKIFEVKNVMVVGNVLANEGSIRRIVGQPNLLWADLSKIKSDIAKDSFIKNVNIEVLGVSSLRVTIDEYKPIANIDISGTLLQIASDGTILSVGDSVDVPIIRGLLPFPFLPGQAIPKDYKYYLSLIVAIRDMGLTEISCQTAGVTLKLTDSCEVFLGENLEEPEVIRQKLKEITMRGQQHKYIDLSQKGYARGL